MLAMPPSMCPCAGWTPVGGRRLSVCGDDGHLRWRRQLARSNPLWNWNRPRRDALKAFLAELRFPEATLTRMEKTRALDGTLAAQGTNVNATWTFYPD